MTAPLPLVAILGPTASGKSALAVQVAARFGGEVVACDSTQLYRHFDIGTGKVSTSDQQGVPHHLMDLLEPGEIFTAGDYRRRAIEVLSDLRRRGKLPVFTAGTGLYLRALLEGLADAPARSEELRARLRQRAEARSKSQGESAGAAYLHRILARLDPASAARIAAADSNKVIRAIEVCLESGRPMSEVHREPKSRLDGWRVIRVGLHPPRDALYARISERIAAMLAAGWLEEVRALVARDIPPDAKPFQFIGYSELRAHLRGEIPLAVAIAAIEQATRRYAKRQITWFRREQGVQWFAEFGNDLKAVNAVLDHLAIQLRL
jgi:tRNA dimethylallyltransferase